MSKKHTGYEYDGPITGLVRRRRQVYDLNTQDGRMDFKMGWKPGEWMKRLQDLANVKAGKITYEQAKKNTEKRIEDWVTERGPYFYRAIITPINSDGTVKRVKSFPGLD